MMEVLVMNYAHNTSNGTTWQVANIRPGSSQSNPGSNMMHVVNGVLYFNAHDGDKGMELWKHDPSTDTTSVSKTSTQARQVVPLESG